MLHLPSHVVWQLPPAQSMVQVAFGPQYERQLPPPQLTRHVLFAPQVGPQLPPAQSMLQVSFGLHACAGSSSPVSPGISKS